MNINIDSIKIVKQSSCIEFRFMQEGMERPTSYYLLKDNIPFVIQQLNGESNITPYFDDITYLFKFSLWGCRAIELSSYCYLYEKYSGQYKEYYFYFPGKEFANILSSFVESDQDSYDVDQKTIQYWKEKYGPNIEIIWNCPEESFLRDINNQEFLSEPCWNPLENLVRIAENNSDGNLVTITIYRERHWDKKCPMDNYYFEVVDTTKPAERDKNGRQKNLVMNGGIIFSKGTNEKYDIRINT